MAGKKKGRKRAGKRSGARAHINRPKAHKRRRSGGRFGRNPAMSLRGVVLEPAKVGLTVVAGQWVAARVAEQVALRVVPDSFKTSSPLASTAVANLVAAIVTTLAARQFVPRHAAIAAAGAYSQAIVNTVGSTDWGNRILSGNFRSTPPAAAAIAGYASGSRARVSGYAADRTRLTGYAREMNTAGFAAAGAGMGF